MIFDYNIPVVSIVLLALAFVGFVFVISFYAYRLRVVRKWRQHCDAEADSDVSGDLPKVSVVMYSRNEADLLAKNLPLILDQEYPGAFEVIVVNDGTVSESDTLVTSLKAMYPNLYLTFAPENSRNISRKKLAITLGVKAAKGDVIIVTDAAMHVDSPRWLYLMAKPFVNPQVEVVIGYNYLNLRDGRWAGRLLTLFDSVADSVAWLSSAIKGKPYRGNGNNIAYRRDAFFRNKGFSTSLNLRDGDDDLFISEIANGDNTVVQLATDAIGGWGKVSGMRKRYKSFRRSHSFTGRKLSKASRRIMAVGEWCIWLSLICALAGAYLAGVNNIFGWAVAAVIILAMCITVIVIWRKTILSLTGRKVLLSLPFIAAFRPLRNIKCNISSGSRFNATYTWQ